MKTSDIRQTCYYDKQMKPLEFEEGENIFLKITPVTIRIGRTLKSKKLLLKFISPY